MKRKIYFAVLLLIVLSTSLSSQNQADGLRWRSISTSGASVMAIRSDGALFGWGDCGSGQLGLGVVGVGEEVNAPGRVAFDYDWEDVRCGKEYTLARKKDGSLWSWGLNLSSQTGQPSFDIAATPRRLYLETDWATICASSDDHSYAIKKDGTLWGWGSNKHHLLTTQEVEYIRQPTKIWSGTDWLLLSAGDNHTLALKKDGTLWGWGDNQRGQLARGQKVAAITSGPEKLSEDTDWTYIYASGDMSFAIKANGQLYLWGSGGASFGAFGGSTTKTYHEMQKFDKLPGKKIMSVSAGQTNTVVLCSGESITHLQIYIWGGNEDGSLGCEEPSQSIEPIALNLPTDIIPARIATGSVCSYILSIDGLIYSWGSNRDGQLGIGKGYLGLFGSFSPLLVPCPGSTQEIAQVSPIDTEVIRVYRGHLLLSPTLADRFVQLGIYDMTGKLCVSYNSYSTNYTLSSLSGGSYYIATVVCAGVVLRKKFFLPQY